ncbi:hypothetical protein B4Q04_10955 [Zobellia sp. OII3]|uniref:DUF3800 domain-containing protein n=1 Tax=Zobellia sp. OII3 TaxID=2034520 RepID=UPI000B5297AB|nr:DUF3800 domain-containing protein [Zobellia sp. OII3]OWW25059.1 hypothetical protein B4Q04_10955 [Zobellia sp. OII3]
MNKIYFDESGNTGQDLLNKDQRVFSLASVNYNVLEQEAIRAFFGTKEEEIHFKQLKNSGPGRKKIISFLNSSWIDEKYIIPYYVNKEFATCAQIVNLLIETVFHNKGFDIYKKGNHIIYSNWIFYFGNFKWNKQIFKLFLESFVEMIRKKDQNSIENFYTLTKELYDQNSETEILEPVLESKDYITSILDPLDHYSIDVTFSTFLVLCDKWSKKLENKIDIRFDQSKQVAHYSNYINEMIELTAKLDNTVEIGFDSRKMTFPHQILSIELVDSKEEFGVQLADIIASSITFAYNNEESKMQKFSNQIKASRLFQLSNSQCIWPTDDLTLKALAKEKGEGINPLGFLTKNFPQGFK